MANTNNKTEALARANDEVPQTVLVCRRGDAYNQKNDQPQQAGRSLTEHLQGNAEIPWSDGQTVLKLKKDRALQYPVLQPIVTRLLVAVNKSYETGDQGLRNCSRDVRTGQISGMRIHGPRRK